MKIEFDNVYEQADVRVVTMELIKQKEHFIEELRTHQKIPVGQLSDWLGQLNRQLWVLKEIQKASQRPMNK